MPRNRTIKPSFWTDEKVVQLSIPSRLLFIGMWNFSDDSGSIEYSPPQIKMRILPSDAVDVVPLINELITTGLIQEYQIDGKKYLKIPTFTKHQVINKPSKTRHPEPVTTGVLPYNKESNTIISLPPWVPVDAWLGFIEMRRQVKAPLSERAAILAIGTLERLKSVGNDPSAVLNQSVMNSWKGLFEVKGRSFTPVASPTVPKKPAIIPGNCRCGKQGTTKIGGDWECDECLARATT